MPDGSADVVLGGRYSLGDVLGTGRSATVYEAVDLLASSAAPGGGPAPVPRLAAKVLHAHIARDPAMRAAFVLEARAGARVRHPGLVTIIDVGEEDIANEPVVWIMMVQAPGMALADVVGTQVPSLSESLWITSRVLDALAAVHDGGLVHRDISPGNVMVELTDPHGPAERVGAVTLLDLGLAGAQGLSVVRSRADPPGQEDEPDLKLVIGTPEFMSPEQARGLSVDARGDLYAVGALLYLMLTGHAPYERSEPAAVLRAHVQAPVPVPSARADVPPAVDRIVSRAMAKSPDRRFASAAEMRAAVDGVLRDGPGRSSTGTRVISAIGGPSARTIWVSVARLDSAEPPPSSRSRRPPPGLAARTRPAEWPRPAVMQHPAVTLRPAVTPHAAVAPRPQPKAKASTMRVNLFLVVICGLVLCGLIGLGWMGTQQEALDGAIPGPLPTTTTGSPSATRGSPLVSGLPTEGAVPTTVGPIASAAVTSEVLPTLVPPVTVPALALLGVEQARARLAAVGLVLGDVSGQDSAKPAGTVLIVDPPAGRLVLVGSVVRLTVASGENLVPSVQGLALAQAFAKVESMGLVPLFTLVSDPVTPPGDVIGVSPDPGTKVPLGSVVTVFVSNGAQPPEPTTPTPPTGQPTL